MCATQVFKCLDCQLLEYFLRAHVFALNMIQSSYNLQSGCPGFRSGGFLSAALFREIHRLRLGQSCGIQSRACGANGRNPFPFVRFTPLPCVCGGFSRRADGFHVPQSFRLAAAIVPRRRQKPARHQFSPLGKAVLTLSVLHISAVFYNRNC